MSTANMPAKRCVRCQRDVTEDKRMKDSSGRYWCINCGGEEQKRKALSASVHRAKSADALKSNQSKGGLQKGRLIKMLAVMGLLALGAALRFTDVF